MTKMIFFAAALLISATAATKPTPASTPTPKPTSTPTSVIFKEMLGTGLTQPTQNKLRHSSKSGGIESMVSCVKFENNTCTCPGGCMSYNDDPTDPKCVLNKCWEWDTDKTDCVETGPNFTPAIVLQAIPFTGVFGAGFGNMGRWDLFGIAMAICFGPLVVLLLWTCCLIFLSSKNSKNDENGCAKCFGNCFGCIWSVAILSWWVFGIVVIADKQINAPDGCPLH